MTETGTEWVKCECIKCKNFIEFEAEHAEEMISCPHCGADTILFKPIQRNEEPDDAPKPRASCQCDHCSHTLTFELDRAGQGVPCPGCGLETVLRVKRHRPPLLPTLKVERPARIEVLPPEPERQRLNQESRLRFFLGLAGVSFLALGVFLPFMRLPFVGSMNYIGNGNRDGIIVLFLAGISLLAVLGRRYGVLWFTAFLSGAVTAFTILNINNHISQAVVRANADGSLVSRAFSATAQTVEMEFGVAVIGIGIILMFAAAAYRERWAL